MRVGERSELTLTEDELRAVEVAWDELTSYFETVGYEGSLDDEEMPTEKIPETIARLRGILDRYAAHQRMLRDVDQVAR